LLFHGVRSFYSLTATPGETPWPCHAGQGGRSRMIFSFDLLVNAVVSGNLIGLLRGGHGGNRARKPAAVNARLIARRLPFWPQ
jgi:hypothetical protein